MGPVDVGGLRRKDLDEGDREVEDRGEEGKGLDGPESDVTT